MTGILGNWASESLDELIASFAAATPYPHVTIPEFLENKLAETLLHEFPSADGKCWFAYSNPIEDKLACNDTSRLPPIFRTVFAYLNSPEVVDLIRKIAGIPDLEADPTLHGGGLHLHKRGGKLDLHLDYSLHPLTGMERRINLIVYMCRDWREEYGGALELWSGDEAGPRECCKKVLPGFNKAVIFQTSDISYHGLPDPIQCPDGMARMSLATYYVSPPREGVTHRSKARFVARPTDAPSEYLDRLRAIRPHRRLEAADLEIKEG